MLKRKTILLFLSIILSFLFHGKGYAEEIVYSQKELLHNGNFEEDYRSWYFINCNPNPGAAKDGKFGMDMSGLGSGPNNFTFFQNIIIPTTLSSASITYDYRVRQWADFKQAANLKVVIGKSKGFDSVDFTNINVQLIKPIAVIDSHLLNATAGWQHAEINLDQNIISLIQTAHGQGDFIFLQFILVRDESEQLDMNVHIDNLSMKISGQQKIPVMKGTVACYGRDPQSKRDIIKLIDPNNNIAKTIWTYPYPKQKYQWKDIKWKPDGSELAFVSDYETPFSPTYTNIYAIRSDGKGLRKISNPPFQNQINNEEYPRINVTGRIKNNTASNTGKEEVTAVSLWIQGARKVIPLYLKPNAKIPFEIEDVANIGNDPDIFEPVIVLHWSNSKCAFGVEYKRPSSKISFSKTDIGTLMFDGLVCSEGSEVNSIRNISWNRDGSGIGFAMIGGLRKIDPAGQSIFNTQELLPFSNIMWPDHMAWSPTDDHYLYYDYDLPGMENAGIYIAGQGDPPDLLVNDAKSTSPAWLPDGSGFLYVRDSYEDRNIYHYNLQNKKKTRLTYFSYEAIENISVSGDGKYAVFEMRNTWATPIESDLWIMDLTNPTEMWQITSDRHSTHPDWSWDKADTHFPQNTKARNVQPINKRDENNHGCFISNLLSTPSSPRI